MVVTPMFTPELLISVPRRGPCIPNHDGTLALFSQSTHDIGGKTVQEFRVLRIETGDSERLFEDDKATDVQWLGDGTNTVVFLRPGEGGITWVKAANAEDPSQEPYVVDFIQAPVSCLRVKPLSHSSIAFVVVGRADAKGELYNQEADKKLHTARVTDSYHVHGWNSCTRPQTYAIWYTALTREHDKWSLVQPLRNTLSGTTLEAPAGMSVAGDALEEFDVCSRGIVFSATDVSIDDPMRAAQSSIYFIELDSFCQATTRVPQRVSVQAETHAPSKFDQGYCHSPRFGPNASVFAFVRAPFDRQAARSIFVKHVDSSSAIDVFTMVTGAQWNLVPTAFEFAPGGHSLYITASDCGRVSLYKLDLLPGAYPQPIMRTGSVLAYYPLHKRSDEMDRLLVTSSTIVEPWICQIVNAAFAAESQPWVVSQASAITSVGLSATQVSEIYFEGAGDYNVHAWVVKPREFDLRNKRYPLCLLVHGGPRSSWDDAWNTMWNLAAWAEQGYIVVAPNITGSEGFGLEFTEAVNDNWGGRPYDDLVNCLNYVNDMPGIDMDNAVAAGGSYGGYMMNWIQGHEVSQRFKAMVCHDGIFNLQSFTLQTDHLSTQNDYGGPPFLWSNFEGLDRYNPARPDLLRYWRTPMLVIHNDKDYRYPITEGLAAFHTLKALGTPARFLSFPDESHVVLKPENALEWHRQIFRWINHWSGISARRENLIEV
ncbi:prolyl oligopeptidase [Xylariales sp. PMI_506]|nr:prolyl oligopeptidase [Xylariales sp. PMI_506]